MYFLGIIPVTLLIFMIVRLLIYILNCYEKENNKVKERDLKNYSDAAKYEVPKNIGAEYNHDIFTQEMSKKIANKHVEIHPNIKKNEFTEYKINKKIKVKYEEVLLFLKPDFLTAESLFICRDSILSFSRENGLLTHPLMEINSIRIIDDHHLQGMVINEKTKIPLRNINNNEAETIVLNLINLIASNKEKNNQQSASLH